jgi:hypothetical protein
VVFSGCDVQVIKFVQRVSITMGLPEHTGVPGGFLGRQIRGKIFKKKK